MTKNITYLLGAGASANAIPVVNAFNARFKIFIEHFNSYLATKFNDSFLRKVKSEQGVILRGIESHYTIDTYAKKLFLQNPILHTNSEYHALTNYLCCYFLYEQLKINLDDSCNSYLKDRIDQTGGDEDYRSMLAHIPVDLDYRYDSLFAGILKTDKIEKVIIPPEFNFISWNYDFQLEKSLMNFTDEDLGTTMSRLNVIGTSQECNPDNSTASLIKINGTAGFLKDNKFSELFDFKHNYLDTESFEIFQKILTSPRSVYPNSLRFAWVEEPETKQRLALANKILNSSSLIVIIGYSFPYFNRDVDRKLFEGIWDGKGGCKVFLQAHKNDIESIRYRLKAVSAGFEPEIFTELDQFLLPNEL